MALIELCGTTQDEHSTVSPLCGLKQPTCFFSVGHFHAGRTLAIYTGTIVCASYRMIGLLYIAPASILTFPLLFNTFMKVTNIPKLV